jgi:hypothetical protein
MINTAAAYQNNEHAFFFLNIKIRVLIDGLNATKIIEIEQLGQIPQKKRMFCNEEKVILNSKAIR